jgi:hypothetical protein
LLSTFARACRSQPTWLQLVFRFLRKNDFHVADDLWQASFELFNGDLIEGGRGEILVRA